MTYLEWSIRSNRPIRSVKTRNAVQSTAFDRLSERLGAGTDLKQDVAVTNSCLSDIDCTMGSITIFLGRGEGSFQTPVSYRTAGQFPTRIAVGDVNADGKLDLAAVYRLLSGLNVGILPGNGDGTFSNQTTYAFGGAVPGAVSLVDVNGTAN
jgi:hypothetical protein